MEMTNGAVKRKQDYWNRREDSTARTTQHNSKTSSEPATAGLPDCLPLLST